jgi:hypothetical protein
MRYLLLFFCLLTALSGQALTLRTDAPARYEAQRGDTLWGIANRYLEYPWEWKDLWQANAQIQNPNRLYPGAIITLHYDQQKPYLRVLQNGTVKLSPHERPLPLEEAIPPIPLEDIRPFLNGSVVLDKDTLANAPYIIAFNTEHLMGAQGDEMYVENLCPDFNLPPGVTISYAIYRRCGVYRDPVTHQFLGYKASLVSYAELVKGGNPATIVLTDIMKGARLQDRVMPNNYPPFSLYFEPKAPRMPVDALVIDLPGDYTQGAEGLVVVLNRGQDAGLQVGDVLGAYSKPRVVPNPLYRHKKRGPCQEQCVTLPPERLGEIMVFRTFTRTSLALVVRSIRAIEKLDIVKNP